MSQILSMKRSSLLLRITMKLMSLLIIWEKLYFARQRVRKILRMKKKRRKGDVTNSLLSFEVYLFNKLFHEWY